MPPHDRAIEAGARAAYHATPRNKPYDKLTLFKKNLYRTEATAAIMAYLAQAGKEGWVMVPVEPTKAMMRAAQATNNTYTLDKWRAMLAAAQNGGE